MSLTFLVNLSKPAENDVTVDYQTSDLTARAGSDYVAVSGTLMIPEGSLEGDIQVPILDDPVAEADETLLVSLTNPTEAKLKSATATGTLVNDDAPAAPTLTVSDEGIKALTFSWGDVSEATHYRLMVDDDGSGSFAQIGTDIPPATETVQLLVSAHIFDWANARYSLDACNNAGCSSSAPISVESVMLDTIGYFKAPVVYDSAELGAYVALSDDGETLAVGAPREDGAQLDEGAVHIYVRLAENWVYEATVKPSDPKSGDGFGSAVALSADGCTLAVGAIGEDTIALDSGAVFVFERSGVVWTEQAMIKAFNAGDDDGFGGVDKDPGVAVALSDDGQVLVVGAGQEGSSARGVDDFANADNSDAMSSGAAYVYRLAGEEWILDGFIKSPTTNQNDELGQAVSLSADGTVLAVGAHRSGVDGGGAGSGNDFGAVFIYHYDPIAGMWEHKAKVEPDVLDAGDSFGGSICLSSLGDSLAVGAWEERGTASGVGGDPNNNDGSKRGAVYVFSRITEDTWVQDAYIKAFQSANEDEFGRTVWLSGDGNWLAVGAKDDSPDRGLTGSDGNTGAMDSGAVYFFLNDDGVWREQAFIKSSNSEEDDEFGEAIALSSDGRTLCVGAPGEDGGNAGIDMDRSDNSSSKSGAVFVY